MLLLQHSITWGLISLLALGLCIVINLFFCRPL
jgi:hypothetical protein